MHKGNRHIRPNMRYWVEENHGDGFAEFCALRGIDKLRNTCELLY